MIPVGTRNRAKTARIPTSRATAAKLPPRDVGGAAAEELPERLDVLEADADLQGINVDAAAPNGEYVVRLRASQGRSPALDGWLAYDCASRHSACQ
jgi:hypothetical protein